MRTAAILLALVPGAALAAPLSDSLGNLAGSDGMLIAIGLALGALIARRRRGFPESAD